MGFVVEKHIENTDVSYSIKGDSKKTEIINEYLEYKKNTYASPNSIRRCAYSLCYYLRFLEREELEVISIIALSYKEQHEHFAAFLQYVKAGEHFEGIRNRKNVTCNMYLGDVLRYYQYLSVQYENYGELKVLKDRSMTIHNNMGVSKKITGKTFRGYLVNDKTQGDSIAEENLKKLIDACTNIRDKLLLMMFAETGFRLGEILGIDYLSDIDYENRAIRVVARENNLNFARAKNNERRKGYISEETYQLLMMYMMKYKSQIEKGTNLFVVIRGSEAGSPLKESAIYSMLRRLEKKTGIKTHPHAIRHYFATERWKNDWDLLLISNALGHKSINTTINYLNVGSEELRDAAEEFYQGNDALAMIEELI